TSSLLFFSAPPAPEIYTLSLHDALPISHLRSSLPPLMAFSLRPICAADWPRISRAGRSPRSCLRAQKFACARYRDRTEARALLRSEEHTSELQSRENLVCRLLLEKKKQK